MSRTVTYGYSPPTAETTVPVAVADEEEVMPWFDEYGRQIPHASNLAEGTMDITDPAPALMATATEAWTQLTAAGDTADVNTMDYHHLTFQVVVANIDDDVTVRVEGSLDGTNWFNLDDGDADTTYTSNGTYLIHKSNFKCKYVHFTFVSETGGTNVTLDVNYLLGN